MSEEKKEINPQELYHRLEAIKYNDNVLNGENEEIKNFAKGYNRCVDHICHMLILEYGVNPFQKKVVK